MKRLTLAALGALALIGSAGAADLRGSSKDSMEVPVAGTAINWTGVYIGGQVGYGVSQHNLSASADVPEICVGSGGNKECIPSGTPVSAYLNGVGGDGMLAGGSVGFDYARGNFLIGAFADYNFSESKADAGLSINDIPLGTASIKEGDSWMIGARAGYLFGTEKRALLYGLVGFGQTDVKYAMTDTNGHETTFDSIVIGVGGEYALTNNLFFGIEARHWLGDEATIATRDVDGFDLTDDYSKTEIMARLRLKFNAGIAGY